MALGHLKRKLREFIHSAYGERLDTFLRSTGLQTLKVCQNGLRNI